jgi:hypothetical protein
LARLEYFQKDAKFSRSIRSLLGIFSPGLLTSALGRAI